MKRKIANLLLVSVALFASCKKEKVCNEGYEGTECDVQIMPTKLKITSIKIVSFPQYDDGVVWDVVDNSAPDVFFKFMKGNVLMLEQSDFYENANFSEGYTYTPSPSITLNDVTSEYTLLLFDNDNSSDDFMGGVNFKLYDSKNEFPKSLLVKGDSGVEFELGLTYEW